MYYYRNHAGSPPRRWNGGASKGGFKGKIDQGGEWL